METIIEYISINIKKTIITVFIIVALIILTVVVYNTYLKKEDPRYTSYSCSKLFTITEQKLLSDKKISVLSATSREEGISPFSLMLDMFSPLSNVVNLVNESNKVIDQASQMHSNSKTNFLTIPMHACYQSFNTDDIGQLNGSINQSVSFNIAVYNWVKTYKDHLDRDYSQMNVVMVMNNSAVGFQSSLNGFFSLKQKITVYTLNNS
jgi:hypothetical protein